MNFRNLIVVASLALALLPRDLPAQTPVPGGLITTATTTTGDQPWIYVRWLPTDGTLAFGTPFAVYLKNGAADSLYPLQSQGVALLAEEESVAGLQLSRARRLGTDLNALERDVDAYTALVRANHSQDATTPAPAPETGPLARKLARLVHEARSGDPRTAQALRQMAGTHPGIALAIGAAWAGPLNAPAGSPMTVELRSWDPVSCQETGIAGRVTVMAGQPEVLQAPGAPVQVPTRGGAGDRLVNLRWATSDALRRQIPLMTGYSVYRVTPAAAQQNGWLDTPPTPAALHAAADADSAEVRLLTDTPLQTGKPFSFANVSFFSGPAGDGVTHYLTDDNARFTTNAAGEIIGIPYPDGTRHFYFAAARDLLGREGAVSPAGEGIACVRLPPLVPADFSLLDGSFTENGAVCQCFTLRWKANAAEGDNDTGSYQIFRGNATTPGTDFARPETLPLIATVPHAPDADGFMQWRDASLPQNVSGQTWWYTIRAVHPSPCPPDNVSGLAPQVYGTLRTGEAAPPPTELVQSFECPLAGLRMDAVSAPGTFDTLPAEDRDPSRRTLRLIITRQDPGVAWIETKWSWLGYAEAEFTRFGFDPESNELSADFALPAFPDPAGPAFLRIQAGSGAGAVSTLLARNFGRPGDVAGWDQDKVRILRGTAAAPALGEVSTANPTYVEMFTLTAPAVPLQAVNISPGCFSASIAAVEHAPFVIQGQSGSWTTITGAEVSNGRLFFCPPLQDPPVVFSAWRAIPIRSGERPCLHFADSTDGRIRPIRLRMKLPPDFGEYRIYRRIDEGALTLLAQGDGSRLPANASEVIREDTGIPATACTLRYFGQTFDKQGTGSALIPLGEPLLLGRRDVAVPTLRAPRAAGTASAPVLRLEWFCPPEGIERFQFRLDPDKVPDSAVPNKGLPSHLFQVDAPRPLFIHSRKSRAALLGKLRPSSLSGVTGVIGIEQPLGEGPVFTMDLPVKLATRYKITLQAISLAGVNSGPGKEFTFAWTPPPAPSVPPMEPVVDWPQRALPDAGFWHPLARAELTQRPAAGGIGPQEGWDIIAPGPYEDYPVGVRIAAIRGVDNNEPFAWAEESPTGSGHQVARVLTTRFRSLNGNASEVAVDIPTWLLRKRETAALAPAGTPITALAESTVANSSFSRTNLASPDSLLPAVLYRRQVPSPRFPNVSGATVQVSPMISKIAAYEPDYTVISDPFIGVVARRAGPPDGRSDYSLDLFLLDTQPVQKGAQYHYTMVRFSPANGELLESIDAGEVLIP